LSRHLKLLYVPLEKHPATRVDLTELFSNQLIGRGHSIDWLMQSAVESPSRLEIIGDRERVFIGAKGPKGGNLTKLFDQLRGWINDAKIFSLVKQGHYDFIQVRDKILAALFALFAAKTSNVPFLYWMSYPYPENDLYRADEFGWSMPVTLRWLYRVRGTIKAWLLYKIILPRADHIFVQSDRMRDDVAAHGLKRSKMTPVPMGVNLAIFNEEAVVPVDDVRLDGRLPIVYVGTLTRIRKMDFIIHVLKEVQSEIPEALLVLVGDAVPKDMQQLRDEVDRLGLQDHVLFTGLLPMKEAFGYVRRAKVCVSPCRPSPVLDPGSPTKLVEYLAWNKPVVANDHPDQSKVLGESGAGIAVPYDVEPFARAIIELLKDEEKAISMAARGRDYVRAHRSYDAIAEQVEQVYLGLAPA
jgi:glycosyltransferase involved in cell wall biosynthesis